MTPRRSGAVASPHARRGRREEGEGGGGASAAPVRPRREGEEQGRGGRGRVCKGVFCIGGRAGPGAGASRGVRLCENLHSPPAARFHIWRRRGRRARVFMYANYPRAGSVTSRGAMQTEEAQGLLGWGCWCGPGALLSGASVRLPRAPK